jgi:murein DD-endopeptidase MepM/ murein hydrolase activator NlpD
MWGRVGVASFLLVAVLVSSAFTSTSTDATTTTTETTVSTSASTTTETTTVSTVETTTTPPPTSSTTTAPIRHRVTTTPTRRARPATLARVAGSGGAGCGDVAAIELLVPGRPPLLLVPRSRPRHHSLTYPAGGSLVRIGSLRLARSCSSRSVEIGSLSLFAGAVTARTVAIHVRGTLRSRRVVVRGLRVDGRAVSTGARAIAIGRWGALRLGRSLARSRGRLASAGALAIRLRRARAGLPAGATVLVAFVQVRAPATAARHTQPRRKRVAKPRRAHARVPRPLKVTPSLGLRGYVFPVTGAAASFGDSYGGFRPDVSGSWHHGDDIFAPLGTPVVAVASGTLNRVGWERIGGWRLWVRDRLGNGFYYAHLSGYSPSALRSRRVRAGQVLGFVGNTGDAFTTPFHLHFEVHPHQLLRLGYDGAVDPTSYLDRWRRVRAVRVPRPVLPARVPRGDPRREARFVFGELLAARGFAAHAPRHLPRIRVPGLDGAVRPFTAAGLPRRSSHWLETLLVPTIGAIALVAAATMLLRTSRGA